MRILGLAMWVSWNSLLALIPVALGYVLKGLLGAPGMRRRPLAAVTLIVVGIAWLFFLPNTCYLLTEWRHFLAVLSRADLYRQWSAGGDSNALTLLIIYTLFFALFSAFGLLTFTLAIRPVAQALRMRGVTLWVWGVPFFFLMSLGVYLGLALRFNSWEVISRPHEILAAALEAASRPPLIALIAGFGVFLWLAYVAVDIWLDGLALRFQTRESTEAAAAKAENG